MYGITLNDHHLQYFYFGQGYKIVEPQKGPLIILSDPKDDPILYTAIAAGADILCVKDRHFYENNVISFCKQNDVQVMDDVALLELLQGKS